MVIVYKEINGNVAVIYPTQEALRFMTIEQIAAKDVPTGLPYKIMNEADLPGREYRNAWDIDESLLNDGIGA